MGQQKKGKLDDPDRLDAAKVEAALNSLPPFGKEWFELHIYLEIEQIKSAQARIATLMADKQDDPMHEWAISHAQTASINASYSLGRFIERYWWKFQHEDRLVKDKQRRGSAGAGGAKSSSAQKLANLEAFMAEIEGLSQIVGQVSDQAILDEAYKRAVTKRKMPKTPKTKADYETELRSVEPFKSRYSKVFFKTA